MTMFSAVTSCLYALNIKEINNTYLAMEEINIQNPLNLYLSLLSVVKEHLVCIHTKSNE